VSSKHQSNSFSTDANKPHTPNETERAPTGSATSTRQVSPEVAGFIERVVVPALVKRASVPSESYHGRETPAAADVLARAPIKEGDGLKRIGAPCAEDLQRITDQLQRLHQATVELTAENLRVHQAIVELTELQRATRPNRGDSIDSRHENEQLSRLSKREREVYPLLAKSNKEISSVLNITESAVKFHVGNITRKLGRPRQEILAKNWLERQ
jgi:DNA-binding CsgD family transcriptional regulator